MLESIENVRLKAAEYQHQLEEAIAGLTRPDLLTELIALQKKLAEFREGAAEHLKGFNLTKVVDELEGWKAQAKAQHAEVERALTALGYPKDLVKQYDTVKMKLEGYKKLVNQTVADLQQLATAHGSEYALRRKKEIEKAIQELEK